MYASFTSAVIFLLLLSSLLLLVLLLVSLPLLTSELFWHPFNVVSVHIVCGAPSVAGEPTAASLDTGAFVISRFKHFIANRQSDWQINIIWLTIFPIVKYQNS
jgi:hypothetical protein